MPAPIAAVNRRMHARYQARVGATASQRLRLARRMVFTVKIPAPAGAKAAIYRALTNGASHPRGAATVHTFTLPRAVNL